MFRNAVRVSGKTPLGTDAAVFPHGQNAKESKLMVDLGMAPIEALKFLTAIDAELFGLVQRWDSRKGKLADIIAMPGDPTAEHPRRLSASRL